MFEINVLRISNIYSLIYVYIRLTVYKNSCTCCASDRKHDDNK